MAHAFQQVMNQLGIKQYKSSIYHPESQGKIPSNLENNDENELY